VWRGLVIWLSSMVLLITALVANAYYRWDQKIIAPIGYEIGIGMDWYEEQEVSLEHFKVQNVGELKKKLKRQGFIEVKENDANLLNGFHRKEDELYWYPFRVSENTEVFKKDFAIAWGLCSQGAGVAINEDYKTSIRLLNPGGTCV